jgi:hypothetical protein
MYESEEAVTNIVVSHPGYLREADVFISHDFYPLLIQDDFTHHDRLFYGDSLVPNFFTFRQTNVNDSILPNRTLLYITHTGLNGERFYVVYGIRYGFEAQENISPEELQEARHMYFSYLQNALEAVPVETLKISLETALKHTLYALRFFIDSQMPYTHVNMFLDFFQLSPLFGLFSDTNTGIFSQNYNAFMIENGISQPAAKVIIYDENTLRIG